MQVDEIPDIDVYINGFPCTPYSLLRRHRTKLMREKAAKPYFKLLEVLRTKRPAMAILENVLGIRKVMNRIAADLVRLEWRCFEWLVELWDFVFSVLCFSPLRCENSKHVCGAHPSPSLPALPK